MSVQDLLGPFGGTFTRLGDALVNRVVGEIFGDGGAARSTAVVIYNHSDSDLYKIFDRFESGGFSPSANANVIKARSAVGYKVESHGVATGVTGALVMWGLTPTDSSFALKAITSNPYIGDNSQQAESGGGFACQVTGSVGNNNTVEIDFFGAN